MMEVGHKKEVAKYCSDIIKGNIASGTFVKKAVKRYLADLKRQDDQDFEYRFHPELADEVIDFAQTLEIPDISTEDKLLTLLPWMKFIYYQVWGWRSKSDSSKRRYRQAYVEVARKNSKTTSILFPFIIWDFLESDAAESYFVSKDGDQSRKSFKELLHIIKANKELGSVINETVSAITYQTSRIAFFSSESLGIDSYKNSLSVIDEFHAYDNDKVVTAFRYGGRARKNNLVMIITSAGNDISGPCYAENEKCKKILNNIYTDETYFGIIYAYDDIDDWKDSAHYIKANPSLGTFLTKEILDIDLSDALITPSHQNDFKSKTCGIWTSGTSSWIPIQKWERNKQYQIDEASLTGMNAVGAFDLSSIADFTAYTLSFRLEDGKYYQKHKFYVPEVTVQEKFKKDNINILGWIQQGLVTVIPGETVDYDWVFNDIFADVKKYNILELVYDKWHSSKLITRLESELYNIPLVKFDQSLKSMSDPTKAYEKAALDGNIVDNNPVMLWMIGNVFIRPDINNNYKPMKTSKSSTQRIDGVITSVMSLDRLVSHGETQTTYTTEDILNSI
jgi:phage terminase large subunit-like protein